MSGRDLFKKWLQKKENNLLENFPGYQQGRDFSRTNEEIELGEFNLPSGRSVFVTADIKWNPVIDGETPELIDAFNIKAYDDIASDDVYNTLDQQDKRFLDNAVFEAAENWVSEQEDSVSSDEPEIDADYEYERSIEDESEPDPF